MRVETAQAANEQRRIDLVLEHVEHAVDETDQAIQGRECLVDVTIQNRVEQGDMTINRLLQILAARDYPPRNRHL